MLPRNSAAHPRDLFPMETEKKKRSSEPKYQEYRLAPMAAL